MRWYPLQWELSIYISLPGITLATSQGDGKHHKENRPSIYISAMTEGGLANMSKVKQNVKLLILFHRIKAILINQK